MFNALICIFRLCLSAIHYNTNSDRMQKVSKDGRAMYAIRFPKSKKGKHSVRPIKTDPNYGMVISHVIFLWQY